MRIKTGLATGLALLIGVLGCDNPNVEARRESGEALREAASKLNRLALSVTYPLPAEQQEQGYQSVLQTLQAAPSVPGHEGARQSLIAKAEIGLAQVKLDQARTRDSALARAQTVIMNLIDIAAEREVMAENDETLSYAEERQQIDEMEEQTRNRRAQLEAQQARLTEQIRDLETEAASMRERAAAIREDAAMTRDNAARATDLDVKDRLITEAHEIGRQADLLEREAATIEAEIDNLRPVLTRTATLIKQTQSELAGYDHTRTAYQKREEQAQREAQELRADLQEMSDQISNEFAELANTRTDELQPLVDDALEHADRATNAARQAMNQTRHDAERVLLATALQTLGEAHLHSARGMERFADLVRTLNEYSELLDRGEEDAVTFDSLQSSATEHRTAAEDAFQSALEAVESVREDDKGAIANLKRGLEQSRLIASGASLDEIEERLPPPVRTVTRTPTEAVGTPENTPRMLFDEAARLVRAEDFNGLIALVHTDSPEEEQVISSAREVFTTLESLDSACESEYGRGLAEILSDPEIQETLQSGFADLMGGGPQGGAGMGMEESPGGMGGLDMSSLSVEQMATDIEDAGAEAVFAYDNSGTTAWVEAPQDLSDMTFVLIDDEWKLDFPDMEETAGDPEPFFTAIQATLQNTTSRVRSGEYGDEITMVQGMLGEFMQQFFALMGDEMGNFTEQMQEEMDRQMRDQGGGPGGG